MPQKPLVDLSLAAALSDCSNPALRQALRLHALARRLHRVLPVSLAPHVRLGNLRSGQLVLFVSTPIWKTRIRLYQQQLLQAAREAGVECHSLDIRVQPESGRPPPAERLPPISASGRQALRDAAAAIGDDALRESLLKLADYSS